MFDFLIYKLLGHIKLVSQTAFTHKLGAASVNKLFISADVNGVKLFTTANTARHYASTTLQR